MSSLGPFYMGQSFVIVFWREIKASVFKQKYKNILCMLSDTFTIEKTNQTKILVAEKISAKKIIV